MEASGSHRDKGGFKGSQTGGKGPLGKGSKRGHGIQVKKTAVIRF